MPTYRYIVKDASGKSQSGLAEAASESDLYRQFRAKSLTLIKATVDEEGIVHLYRLSASEVADFAREIANMTGAGITVVRALSILKDSDVKEKLRTVYNELFKRIYNGLTLSEALRSCGNSFPELFVNMCASGEASGQLEKTMGKMASHYDKEHRLNAKVKSAMTYPMILLVMTVGIVVVLFTFVLPQFFTLFEDAQLPGITRLMMRISHLLTSYWLFILIGVLILVAIIQFVLKMPRVRRAFDHFKLVVPIMGKLLRVIYTARFSRALSSLTGSGLPLINALTISSKQIGNTYIEQQFPAIINDIRNGDSLSASIRKIDGFDNKLHSTIFVGEESGRLVNMLESMAENYDFEAEAATTRLVTLLEPIMIVVMAVVVGGVMLAVMLPIFQLYQTIQ